jgi:hypothetical protein
MTKKRGCLLGIGLALAALVVFVALLAALLLHGAGAANPDGLTYVTPTSSATISESAI